MFIEKQQLNLASTGITVDAIIANSAVVTVGKAVKIAAGFAAPLTAGDSVYGIVTAIVNEDGTPVITDGTVGAALGSFRDTYTVGSDNQTVAKVKVKVNISKETIYAADLDATAGTTVGSDLAGVVFDVADDATIDESAITGTQFFSHGIDASGKVLVSIKDSQVQG